MDCFEFSKRLLEKDNTRLALEYIMAAEKVYDELSEPKIIVENYEGNRKSFDMDLIQASKEHAIKKVWYATLDCSFRCLYSLPSTK